MVFLYIKLYSSQGKFLTLDVDQEETIAEVKERISKLQSGVPIKLLKLYHGSTLLEDHKKIKEYSIKDARFSGYVFVSKDIQIRILPQAKKEFTVTIDPERKIEQLKQQIAHILSIDFDTVELVFYGRKLPDYKAIVDCNINNGAMVYLTELKFNKQFGGDLTKSKAQVFSPQMQYLRKNFTDVQKSINTQQTINEKEKDSRVIRKLPLLNSGYESQKLTRRSLVSLNNN